MARQNTTVDPGRYWANRNTGQRTLAAIGAFLGGLGGGPNEVMAHIQKAISEDIDAQRATIDATGRNLGAQMAGQQTMLGMMRMKFSDDYEALKATEASALASTQLKLQELSAKYASPELKAKADMVAAQLEQEKQKALQDFAARRDENAQRQALLNLKMGEAATKGAGRGMTAAEAANLGDLSAVEKHVDALFDAKKRLAGNAVWAGVTQYLPGTDASKFNDVADQGTQFIGSPLEGGKLSDEDKTYYRKLLPQAGDGEARTATKKNAMKQFLRFKYQGRVKGLGQAGFDTSGFPEPYAPTGGFEKE